MGKVDYLVYVIIGVNGFIQNIEVISSNPNIEDLLSRRLSGFTKTDYRSWDDKITFVKGDTRIAIPTDNVIIEYNR